MPLDYTGVGAAQFDEPSTLAWPAPIVIGPDTVIELTLRVARISGADGDIVAGLVCYDAAGTDVGHLLDITTTVTSLDWVELYGSYDTWPVGTAYVLQVFQLQTVGSVVQVDEFSYEDATAVVAAESAVISSATATTKATEAGTFASAAQSERLLAETARSGAETAAISAVTSETNADGSAASAATSASNAANSETASGASATASSESASVSITKATEASQSATAADTSKLAAETARAGSETAETNAATSETAAAGSAASSLTSATNAATSETASGAAASAAAGSATLADTKATEAGQSATASNASKLAAETAQSNAETSASSAAISETNAGGASASAITAEGNAAASETASGASASAAAGSASVADTKATEASQSATAANTAKLAAETARSGAETASTNAATSETNSSSSASSAATSASNSASSENAAGTSATAAASSASLADTKATEATQSATSASTSANTATTKAAAATTSETNAAQSETNASGSSAIAVSAKNTAVAVSSQGGGALSDMFLPLSTTAWSAWNTGPVVSPNEIYPTGNTFSWNVTSAGANAGAKMSSYKALWPGTSFANGFRVEVEFELISGSPSGAGIWLDFVNGSSASTRKISSLANMVQGDIVTGQVQTGSAVFTKPDSFVDTPGYVDIYLAINTSVVGTGAAKNIKVHKVQLYPISITDASVIEQASAIVDLAGNASAGYLIKAQAGTEVSLLDLIAADGTTGSVSVAKISATNIILDGSVKTQHLEAEAITADKILAGTITSENISTVSFSAAGLAIFGGTIQSSNFVGGSAGWRIFQSGYAEFNGVLISRQLQLDTGTFVLPTIPGYDSAIEMYSTNTNYWIETNIAASAWTGVENTVLALVGREGSNGTVYSTAAKISGEPQNIKWGFEADVVALTRWSGNQRVWIKVQVWTQNVTTMEGFILRWRLIQVT